MSTPNKTAEAVAVEDAPVDKSPEAMLKELESKVENLRAAPAAPIVLQERPQINPIDALVERANKIADEQQRKRKSAPMVSIGEHKLPVVVKQLIAQHCPNAVGKGWNPEERKYEIPPTEHAMFVPEKDLLKWAYKGFKPVVDKNDTDNKLIYNVVDGSPEVMVKCPLSQYEENIERSKQVSQYNLMEPDDDANAAASKGAAKQTMKKVAPGTPEHAKMMQDPDSVLGEDGEY